MATPNSPDDRSSLIRSQAYADGGLRGRRDLNHVARRLTPDEAGLRDSGLTDDTVLCKREEVARLIVYSQEDFLP